MSRKGTEAQYRVKSTFARQPKPILAGPKAQNFGSEGHNCESKSRATFAHHFFQLL